MATEIIFYTLAPKPAVSGDKTYAAAAAGKVSKGRKWYRLECRPCDVYQFPDGIDDHYVLEWLDKNPESMRSRVVFAINDEFYPTGNEKALSFIPGGDATVNNSIERHKKGRDGWVVFIPNE